MIHNSFLAMAATLALTVSGAHALTVNPTEDADTLATSILGTGVSISNETYSDDDEQLSAGTFTGGGSTIGIDSGIIISTGAAADAEGPNDSDLTGTGGTVGALSLDFTTTTGALFFNYVWASEEYNEFVDSDFNDTFEFLLSGPGISGTQNIALLPNGDPVTINNVNLGDNASVYNNNDPDDFATPPFNIEYDGFTDVLTAAATGLTIGETYTLEMIVSDVGDSAYDSAVFIAGGSFGGVTPPVDGVIPLPASLPLLLAGMGVLGVMRRRKPAA